VLSSRSNRNISRILGDLGASIRMFVTEFDMSNNSDQRGARKSELGLPIECRDCTR
jgi:hypothetical protein